MSDVFEAIASAVSQGDESATVSLVREALEAGVPASEILARGLTPGMQALGDLFTDGQAFLPEILISARAMKTGLAELRPLLGNSAAAGRGTVVLGTVEGDLHDIGKSLVGMLLEGNGFEVIDLGVDVKADAFIEAVQKHHAGIVALSALLTTATPQFRRVLDSLGDTGLRDQVKVMVGGASVSSALADEIGADGFAPDCVAAVGEAERILKG